MQRYTTFPEDRRRETIEELIFAIEEWTADSQQIVEVLARAGNFEVAAAAYWAATRVRPRAPVTLRQRGLVLRQRLPADSQKDQ